MKKPCNLAIRVGNGIFNVLLLVIIVSSFLVLSTIRSYSQSDCLIRIVKEVTTAKNVEFEFNQVLNGIESPLSVTSNTIPVDVFISKGDNITITEVAQEDWELADIQCTASPNMTFTKLENGFQAGCLVSGTDSGVVCTFLNRPSPDNIPILSQWGFIALAVALGIIGVVVFRKRKGIA